MYFITLKIHKAMKRGQKGPELRSILECSVMAVYTSKKEGSRQTTFRLFLLRGHVSMIKGGHGEVLTRGNIV